MLYEDFAASKNDGAAIAEVLPANDEQLTSIANGLTKPLSIVTGPPGTGKSQVVVNLIINQTMRGGSVLFTSRNNKAVDVVEQRINRLNRRPVMLRLGGSRNLAPVLDFIRNKLNEGIPSQPSRAAYQQTKDRYKNLCLHEKELNEALAKSISLRNRLASLEYVITDLRDNFDKPLMELPYRYAASYAGLIDRVDSSIKDCYKTRHNAAVRLLWSAYFKGKKEKLRDSYICETNRINALAGFPALDADDFRVDEWQQRAKRLKDISQYCSTLDEYLKADSIEMLFRKLDEVKAKKVETATNLWNKWLAVNSPTLSATDRSRLSAYISAVKLNNGNAPDNYGLTHDVDRILRRLMPVSCVTALSAHGRLPLAPSVIELLIIDEASQCDIASIVPLLFRAKRVVVIGDPRQLTHITTVNKSQDYELIQHFGIDPKWSFTSQSLYNLATSVIPSQADITALRDHHRSHADIIGFSNMEFYDGNLRIATDYSRLAGSSAFHRGINWVDVNGLTMRPTGGSALNKPEAEAVVKVIGQLMADNDFTGSIGVVTPFRRQAQLINSMLEANGLSERLIAQYDFVCATAHSFQGDEHDAIIFSPVISEGCPMQSIAFLQNTSQLFNVAITRARSILIMVADRKALTASGIGYLSNFVDYTDNIVSSVIGDTAEATGSHRSAIGSFLNRLSSIFGIGPRTEVTIDKYRVDVVFDLFDGLIIDFDIDRYSQNWTAEDVTLWQLRAKQLRSLGYEIMHFEAAELIDAQNSCVDAVTRWFDRQRNNA